MRLFIGIPLDARVAGELEALTGRLKPGSEGLRWSAAAGWHITLQFLGQTGVEQYACVTDGLSRIRHAPFEVQLEPPGFFDRAGVFFAGVRLSPELTGLQKQVTIENPFANYEREERALAQSRLQQLWRDSEDRGDFDEEEGEGDEEDGG